MSLAELAARARDPGVRLLSSDVFDTVLLRDHSTETARLAQVGRVVADRHGLDPDVVTRLRWWAQDDAYRTVAVGRPDGDARLEVIWTTIARSLGLDAGAASTCHAAEVEVDIGHLRAHRALLNVLCEAADRGLRVVAVSDTYYTEADLRRMLAAVVGPHPFDAVHSSGDLGLTKHSGSVFAAVARAEGVEPHEVLHVGDDRRADVEQPRAAGWRAVHLPRAEGPRVVRALRRSGAARQKLRRTR